jgi:predicted RecA/RadA family phage recombinase
LYDKRPWTFKVEGYDAFGDAVERFLYAAIESGDAWGVGDGLSVKLNYTCGGDRRSYIEEADQVIDHVTLPNTVASTLLEVR